MTRLVTWTALAALVMLAVSPSVAASTMRPSFVDECVETIRDNYGMRFMPDCKESMQQAGGELEDQVNERVDHQMERIERIGLLGGARP